MTPMAVVRFLEPYEFSPTVALLCTGTLWLFLRGQSQLARNNRALGPWRVISFLLGMILMYGALQTRFDFLSQHMFFIHRIQHMLLHHLAPFLIALSAPQAAIMAGMPASLQKSLVEPVRHSRLAQRIYRGIQRPTTSAFLFVALIYLWLFPDIHFYAMLNVQLYNVMNWSMAIDGLLFWWMVLNMERNNISINRFYGIRILMLFLVMIPQILIGSHIALSHHNLYSVYAVCGRVWPISPMVDQELGGLITWIPTCMMSALAGVIVIGRWMRQDDAVNRVKPVPLPVAIPQERRA